MKKQLIIVQRIAQCVCLCVGAIRRRGLWWKEMWRHRYTLRKGQRLSCLDARIPNKKFLIAKSLYLQGHFWLSICCHLSLHCPHSTVARRWMQHGDQRWARKQYGAGKLLIVLSMVLVQSLCVRWAIIVFDWKLSDLHVVNYQLHSKGFSL